MMSDRGWTGVVLAGGQSSRMGRDKALIEIDGRTMLDRSIELLRPHCREVLVIGDPLKYAPAHAAVLPDDAPGQGPLGGVLTAMRHARYVRLLVLACDLPGVNERLLFRLKDALLDGVDAAVPQHHGFIEPLASAWHRHGIEALEVCVAQGRLKMSDALATVNTAWLSVTPGEDGWPADLFRNLNRPDDL